jgi:N-formylglutamate amidohydrolase
MFNSWMGFLTKTKSTIARIRAIFGAAALIKAECLPSNLRMAITALGERLAVIVIRVNQKREERLRKNEETLSDLKRLKKRTDKGDTDINTLVYDEYYEAFDLFSDE